MAPTPAKPWAEMTKAERDDEFNQHLDEVIANAKALGIDVPQLAGVAQEEAARGNAGRASMLMQAVVRQLQQGVAAGLGTDTTQKPASAAPAARKPTPTTTTTAPKRTQQRAHAAPAQVHSNRKAAPMTQAIAAAQPQPSLYQAWSAKLREIVAQYPGAPSRLVSRIRNGTCAISHAQRQLEEWRKRASKEPAFQNLDETDDLALWKRSSLMQEAYLTFGAFRHYRDRARATLPAASGGPCPQCHPPSAAAPKTVAPPTERSLEQRWAAMSEMERLDYADDFDWFRKKTLGQA